MLRSTNNINTFNKEMEKQKLGYPTYLGLPLDAAPIFVSRNVVICQKSFLLLLFLFIFAQKRDIYSLATHWNCLLEAIPISSQTICYFLTAMKLPSESNLSGAIQVSRDICYSIIMKKPIYAIHI